jgi:hypothetical protein
MNINQSIEYQMTISTVKFVGYEMQANGVLLKCEDD